MLTRPPLTQVFIPVLEEHIVIMLIMLAEQPEARREGPSPELFPSPGAVGCLPESPDRRWEGCGGGAGGAGAVGFLAPGLLNPPGPSGGRGWKSCQG